MRKNKISCFFFRKYLGIIRNFPQKICTGLFFPDAMSSSDSSDTLEEILRPSDSESSRFSTEEENPFINTLWGIHQTLSTLRGMKFHTFRFGIRLNKYFLHRS